MHTCITQFPVSLECQCQCRCQCHLVSSSPSWLSSSSECGGAALSASAAGAREHSTCLAQLAFVQIACNIDSISPAIRKKRKLV